MKRNLVREIVEATANMFWDVTGILSGSDGESRERRTERSEKKTQKREKETVSLQARLKEIQIKETSAKTVEKIRSLKFLTDNPAARTMGALLVKIQERRIQGRLRRRAARLIICPECEHANEPPAVYCENCNESFLHIGKFFILSFITVSFSCFFSAQYYREVLGWPWPLYIFFGLAFVVMNGILLKGARGFAFPALVWGFTAMAIGGVVFQNGLEGAREFALLSIRTFGEFLFEQPIAGLVFAGGMGVTLLIVTGWMTTHYGFVRAYRVVLFYIAVGLFALEYAYPKLLENKDIAKSLSFVDEDLVLRTLDLASINLLRVLLAEIVVFAMASSYRAALDIYAKRKMMPNETSAKGKDASAHAIDSIYRVSLQFANAGIRTYLQIEQAFFSLMTALKMTGLAIRHFTWMLIRDSVLPILSLVAAVYGAHALAVSTDSYIAGEGFRILGRIFVGVGIIFLAQFVFLSSRARLSPLTMMGSSGYVVIWIAPYVLMAFVFVSASLWTIGMAMARWNENLKGSFTVGPLTIVSTSLIALIVGYAVVRRHREGSDAPPNDDTPLSPTKEA